MKMTKQTQTFAIAGGAILLAVLAYFFLFNKKKEWRFKDNYFSDGNLGFVGNEQPPFRKGDVINVTQDAGAKFPAYDGPTKVTRVYKKDGKFIVEVEKRREGNTPANPGIITG